MRLDKYLAEASVGTRKKVRNYVKKGQVMVNDLVVYEPAMEIEPESDIILYNQQRILSKGKIYYMFHKPAGCITARTDPNTKTIMEYFTQVETGGLFPVGRLDKDTEGLLLLTNDGEFDHGLMTPGKHVPKTYYFWALGTLNQEKMDGLRKGIVIHPDEPPTCPGEIILEKTATYGELKAELELLLEGSTPIKRNPREQMITTGYLTISEGRKHQVKRMLKAVGCQVIYLKRISIGKLFLDAALKKGEFRKLTQEEIELAEQI